ncbi:MAG TPA: glycoside hydrolase family 99-like domain-containing protein [Actinopolymorphaceae bacterium]
MVDVAAIYFPSWHPDPRQEARYGMGWSEWELVKSARPRFPGHRQPLRPSWGHADESDPDVMARSVAVAADHGIDAFLWDWYWYDEQDFLNRPLDEAYLGLADHRTKFALMWANHDWRDVFPARVGRPLEFIWPAAVDARQFREMTAVVIERYLTHPAYWRVNGAAWFTIFQLQTLMDGLGGEAACARALEDFRERARAAGAGELHLNAMGGRWDGPNPTRPTVLGIDSVGPYNWSHLMPRDQGLAVPYGPWREAAQAEWRVQDAATPVTYVPNVTMGWDSTARVHQDDPLEIGEWPMLPVVVDNTPEQFERAVVEAVRFLEARDDLPVLTVNAWNEWTEGSCLEPEELHGMAYLQALARGLGIEASG